MGKPVVVVASDHAGVELKAQIKDTLTDYASKVIDLGTDSEVSVDYPDYAKKVAKAILKGRAAYGVAMCGTGIGISMALNRHKGIRAALVSDGPTAALARRHNDANVLCLGARLISNETARECVQQFFSATFEGGRHKKRVKKLDN